MDYLPNLTFYRVIVKARKSKPNDTANLLRHTRKTHQIKAATLLKKPTGFTIAVKHNIGVNRLLLRAFTGFYVHPVIRVLLLRFYTHFICVKL
jgi:hypothetical protein